MASSIVRPTFAEIDLDALAFNFHSAMKFIGADVECMAIVKADSYGHGAIRCSQRLQDEGVVRFGVALVEEAVELRQAGVIGQIVVLGGFWPGQERDILNFDITPVVFGIEQARALDEASKNVERITPIHVKIDTGMGRVGIPFKEVDLFAKAAASLPNITIEGLMTHFAVADDLGETDFTNTQMERFTRAVEQFHAAGFRPSILDMANSPAAIAHPLSRLRLVRLGGILYGLGGDVIPKQIDAPELRPVLSLSTKVAFLKTVAAGESVGYGRTFVAQEDTVVATLSIGYRDGLNRALSNRGEVIVRGTRVPIIGRISMDWTTVDVSSVANVAVGDEVTIIGTQGNKSICAEDIAQTLGTISYEVTCSVSSRVPRMYKPEPLQ